MYISLRIVLSPRVILVEGGVEVEEVREETPCAHLAGELVEVVVRVFRQIAHTSLLLPYLDRENSRRAVSDAFIGRIEHLPDDAAALCGGVGSVVDGTEHHLVSATGVYCVHIVDKSLHGLMHPADGLVHGVELEALLSLKSHQVSPDVVVDDGVPEVVEVLSGEG